MKYWKIISINAVAITTGLYLAVFGFNLPSGRIHPEQIDGLFWPQQKQLDQFEMVDHRGRTFELASLEGHWNLVFFGYTSCPDICPITMTTLRQVADLLKADDSVSTSRPPVRMVFISVDAERDNSEHLASYINFYGDAFIAASGNISQVDSLTTQLGVPYEIEPHEPGEHYLVSHTGSLFLLSPDGKLFAVLHPPHTPDQVARQLTTIRQFIDQQS